MFFIRKHGFLFVAILSFIFGLSFYSSEKTNTFEMSFLEKVVYQITKPVEFLFKNTSGFLVDNYSSYIDLINLKEKYNKILEENAVLKVKISSYQDLSLENERLKDIFKFKQKTGLDFLVGKIMRKDPSFIFKSVKINVGSLDGVVDGMGVVSAQGVVGTVIRVQQKTADVLLVTDPNSSLDVIVARNRRRGVLQGGFDTIMQFKYFDRDAGLLVGDKIVTSGLTGAFPSDLPVGTIVKVKSNTDNTMQTIEVEPSANFSKLQETLVLKNKNPETENIKTVAGISWIEKIMDAGKMRRNEK